VAGHGRLAAIHLIPTAQMFIGMIFVYVAVTRPGDTVTWLMRPAFGMDRGLPRPPRRSSGKVSA
jgi:hypothetical protein